MSSGTTWCPHAVLTRDGTLWALVALLIVACSKDVRDTPLPREFYGTEFGSVRDALKPDEQRLLYQFIDYERTLRPEQREALKGKTYRDAFRIAQDLAKKQESVMAQVRELVEEPSMQFTRVHTGPDGAVCGTLVEKKRRVFIALPNEEVLVSGSPPTSDEPEERRAYDRETRHMYALAALHCWSRPGAAAEVARVDAEIARAQPLVPPSSADTLAPEDRVMLETRSGNHELPTEGAQAAAVRLGTAANANALAVIVDMHSSSLAQNYRSGFGRRSAGAVPPAIERVVLDGISDDKLRESLVYLLRGNPDCQFRYSDRELFDALREQLVAHQEEFVAKALLCSTLADIEEPLAQTLAQLRKSEAAVPLIAYFKEHRSAVAVPALTTLQAEVPLPKAGDTAFLHSQVNEALLVIRNDAAIDAVKKRIHWLIEHRTDPDADEAARSLMVTIGRALPDGRLQYADIKPLPKTFTGKDMQKVFVEWVRRWRAREAIPDLYELLDTENAAVAADAILEAGTPDDWSKLDRWIASNARSDFWAGPQAKAVREHLRLALKDPDKELVQRSERQSRDVFGEVQARLSDERVALIGMKDTDPKRYAAREKARLERTAKLAQEYRDSNRDVRQLNRSIFEGYRGLGGFLRFTMHDPNGAVEAYRRAMTFSLDPGDATAGNSMFLVQIALADTLRFDLNDRAGAVKQYREALAGIPDTGQPTKDRTAGLQTVASSWVKAEIAYLSDGTPASRPNQQDCAMVWLVMQLGAFSADDPDLQQVARSRQGGQIGMDRTEVARRLWALSPTPAHLLATMELWPLLGSADSVISFLRKHDPSGFLTACVLQSVEAMPRAQAASSTAEKREGAQRAWSSADIAMMQEVALRMLGSPPPARAAELQRAEEMRQKLTDPEQTWRTFLAALRGGDLPTVWACMTPELRNKFEPGFSQMKPEQLRTMADSFTGFALTAKFEPFREAIVKRSNGRVGFVYFVNTDGAWRIEEM